MAAPAPGAGAVAGAVFWATRSFCAFCWATAHEGRDTPESTPLSLPEGGGEAAAAGPPDRDATGGSSRGSRLLITPALFSIVEGGSPGPCGYTNGRSPILALLTPVQPDKRRLTATTGKTDNLK